MHSKFGSERKSSENYQHLAVARGPKIAGAEETTLETRSKFTSPTTITILLNLLKWCLFPMHNLEPRRRQGPDIFSVDSRSHTIDSPFPIANNFLQSFTTENIVCRRLLALAWLSLLFHHRLLLWRTASSRQKKMLLLAFCSLVTHNIIESEGKKWSETTKKSRAKEKQTRPRVESSITFLFVVSQTIIVVIVQRFNVKKKKNTFFAFSWIMKRTRGESESKSKSQKR